MKNRIHRDLRRIERRESHLWAMAFTLLILFGTVTAGRYAFIVLHESGTDSSLSQVTAYRVAAGLLFLVTLFCLYAVHTLLLNRRMKSLLAEMSSVAASSMELEEFLPSIARKIAATSSVATCRIALLDDARTHVRVTPDRADAPANRQGALGKTYALEQLPVCGQAVETRRTVLLSQRDLARLPADGGDHELFSLGSGKTHSILIVPMIADDRVLGLVILARARGILDRRFSPSVIAMTRVLASHAATAIDQAKLKSEAIHDPLTNLYNRRHFSQRLKEEIAWADRSGHLVAVLLCDLDRFKAVNDTQGHQVGDEVLRAVSQSIKASTRGTDLVFRWGGDEFVVILSNTSRQGTLVVADRIRRGIRETVRAGIDVSIGVALYPEHGRDEDELIRTADLALYIAKKSGEGVRVGEEDYQLDRSAIKVVFQPVVDLSSNRILGYEALTRDPQGKLSPYELFEKYRTIGRLGELKQLTLKTQMKVAREIGLDKVFINVDFGVLSRVEPIARPPDLNVVLELSELEALHDLKHHLEVARKWRAEGYQFAIDDFGAGFISLPFLAMLVPEYVKVDRSTILQAVADEKFKRFLEPLLRAVQTYAVEGIVAEGVENEKELQLVQDLRITLVQGFLFGKPKELTGPISLDVRPVVGTCV